MNEAREHAKNAFKEAWEDIKNDNELAKPNQQNPQAFVLGGQPGAGKSNLTKNIQQKMQENVIEINGDNFRKYHPNYKEFQEKYKQDSPKYTAAFAAALTEAILQKAIAEKYNIVIEGTFRTAQTPINTLQNFKNNGYETNVLIQTCNCDVSWNSCLERYEKMLEVNPKEARYTDKAHHDLVVKNLANNIKTVQKSGLVDNMQIFARIALKGQDQFVQKEIYNSQNKKLVNTVTINKFIGNNKALDNNLEISM